jgi:hypothetical protein
MSRRDETKTTAELTDEELEQKGRPLPDREAMSIIAPGYEEPVPVDPLPDPWEHEMPDDRLEQ